MNREYSSDWWMNDKQLWLPHTMNGEACILSDALCADCLGM